MLELLSQTTIDTRVAPVIRIEKAALDDSAVSPAGMVMRGRVSSSTLRFLKVDGEYQRKLENRPDIFDALKKGVVVPDIDIGVRGQSFRFEGDDCIITSPAYIIDGAQRVGTALAIMDLIPGLEVRIGALVHFDTTRAWEADRFTSLNSNAKRVSPSLHLRNMRDSNYAILTLYGLSVNEPHGVLQGKVCWEQNMQRGQLMTAATLVKTCRDLHMHLTPISNGSLTNIADDLTASAEYVSLPVFRRNCSTFFELIDTCWGLRAIEYRTAAPQIKTGFMTVFAKFLAKHKNFWSEDGKVLCIDSAWRRCLKDFKINDPNIRQLASSGGPALKILAAILEDHANSGKRVNLLVKRPSRRPS